jgi:hypothetical protein
MPKFTRAFHTSDAIGRTRTMGIDESGRIYLLDTDAKPVAEYAVLDFQSTIRFANMLVSLALESLGINRVDGRQQIIPVPTMQIQCCTIWIPYPTPDYTSTCHVCGTVFAVESGDDGV